MMKKLNKIIIAYLLLIFLLTLTNCGTEESAGQDNIEPSSVTNDVKTWFDNNKNNYSTSVLDYVEDLQWQNAIISNGDIGEVVEVPLLLRDNLSATNEVANLHNDYHRLMFVKDSDKEYSLFYVQIFSNDENYILDKNFDYYTINDSFDGEVYVQELKTKTGNRLEFIEGNKVQSLTSKMREMACVYYGYWNGDGSFTPLYEVGCYGGSGGNGVSSGESDRSNPGPSYGGGSSSSSTKPLEKCPGGYVYKFGECILDKKIFDQLTGKAKCIYERLLTSTSFNNAIQKFDGDFSVSHLKLTINNNLPLNVYGETQLPVNYVTEVQINNNGLNNLSDLGKAIVFAHEIIHAEIYRKMLSAAQIGTLTQDSSNMTVQQQVNYINSMKNNFPGLYDYYYNRYKPTWNHEMMANHYRATITDIIKQFDNNRLPQSAYDAVSWLGLGELDTNNNTIAWDNLSADEKIKITNLINENVYKGPSNCN